MLKELLMKEWASLMAQMVKNLPAMQETWVQSLGWEDPLEKGMATHSSILAWRIPWTEEPDALQSVGSQRVGHEWATYTNIMNISCYSFCSSMLDRYGLPRGSDGKESDCNAGDLSSIPGLGRSPEEGNNYLLQYSCLENSMDRGGWQATVHGVAESDMTEWLSTSHMLDMLLNYHS